MFFLQKLFRDKFIRLSVLSKIQEVIKRTISVDSLTCGVAPLKTPLDAYYNHFTSLPFPDNKAFATYVWIDGTGIKLRSKDRVLENIPCDLSMIPKWSFDGSSTGQAETANSDTQLVPIAIYRDPFRKGPHVIVLCETYYGDGKPVKTNYRARCAKILSDISDQNPWFGIEQEYTMFDTDVWPLGWPKTRGLPSAKPEFAYCGMGEHVAGREIVECHARACLYSGMDFGGTNAEVMKGSWEFQVGTTHGIKAADDLWMGRYLIQRIAEHFGVIISYHPKPMGKYQPGIGCHHNFSVDMMRKEGGIKEIENVCDILCESHKHCMENYGRGQGQDNRERLTGKFETAAFEKCRWAVADRGASIRLQRSVSIEKKGFLEDRRPAGDCDPYRVCAILASTCLKK